MGPADTHRGHKTEPEPVENRSAHTRHAGFALTNALGPTPAVLGATGREVAGRHFCSSRRRSPHASNTLPPRARDRVASTAPSGNRVAQPASDARCTATHTREIARSAPRIELRAFTRWLRQGGRSTGRPASGKPRTGDRAPRREAISRECETAFGVTRHKTPVVSFEGEPRSGICGRARKLGLAPADRASEARSRCAPTVSRQRGNGAGFEQPVCRSGLHLVH